MCVFVTGLRGAPGYSLEQAHHLPIEMDSVIGEYKWYYMKNKNSLFYIIEFCNI